MEVVVCEKIGWGCVRKLGAVQHLRVRGGLRECVREEVGAGCKGQGRRRTSRFHRLSCVVSFLKALTVSVTVAVTCVSE